MIENESPVSRVNTHEKQNAIGLFEKIEAVKIYKNCEEMSISLLKFSNDETVSKFADLFKNGTINSPNIGLSYNVKIIPHPENENNVVKLIIYDYNYILSKKFKHLKNEAISSGEFLMAILNIYDKRGVENFKANFEEIKQTIHNKNSVKKGNTSNMSNMSNMSNTSNISNIPNISNMTCVLLKSTNNFLAKIMEKQTLENIKLDLTTLGLKNFIEIEEETSFDTDCLIGEIIFK